MLLRSLLPIVAACLPIVTLYCHMLGVLGVRYCQYKIG
jgi:hypothetical protein